MISTENILDLYRKYSADLKRVRLRQYWFYRYNYNTINRWLYKRGIRSNLFLPMLDDVEAEITYLLIREHAPQLIVEMSPNSGWSTTWILSALKDNGGEGQLWSYDLHDLSTRFVPKSLRVGRWHFVLGDVRENILDASQIDYFFIDSDHTKQFAQWYVKTFFPFLKQTCKVSVHDVFHDSESSEEGKVVISWLDEHKKSFWTSAGSYSETINQALLDERKNLGISFPIHRKCKDNSMIFFDL